MAPRRVGRYLLGEVIGVGSFATVHRALDERLDDTVVVKVLAENHSLNPEIRERFIAEGRALRRVRSPHVVTVHDLGESERQQPYLVLQHADRGTLAHRVAELRRAGRTPAAGDVLVVARQLAAAMEALHEARLVHRDLSPSNVLVTSAGAAQEHATVGTAEGVTVLGPDEHLLVADLGMSKDLAVSSGLTVAGGTSGFRPPEMDAGPAVIDTRADLWSLSSLMTWLCQDADLPPDLGRALGRSLSVDPEDRHPDVAAWLADVEQALAPPPPSAPATEDTDETSGPASTRHRLLGAVVAAALVALLLGLLTGWLLGSGGPDEATDSARIEIDGPAQVHVGEPAIFTLRHVGVDSWVWVLPTGLHIVDEEQITLTPTGAGSSEVEVTSRDAEGRTLATSHRFVVVDE